jgi:S1-C subfamily serine protease
VIGINTAIFTNTGTSAGVGFAIPIDSVVRVVPQLIRDGQVTTPTLGVSFASPAIASSLKVSEGALIQVRCAFCSPRLQEGSLGDKTDTAHAL